MWNWAHFSTEGWVAHSKRSAKLGALLLLSGLAMLLHLIIPFWQQPKFLRARAVSDSLCRTMEECKERNKHRNFKM
tara:strand:- start:34 stop:261 length:228 start_codon:yes stop_codon:yes gene_type:complete